MKRVMAAVVSALLIGQQVHAAGFADELKKNKGMGDMEALQRYGFQLGRGMQAFDEGKYKEALGYFAEAANAASALDATTYASSKSFAANREAITYEKLGEIDKALAAAAEAKELCKPAKDDQAVECTYLMADLASVYATAKKSDEAYRLLEKGIPAQPSRVENKDRTKMVDHVAALMMGNKDWAIAGKTLELSLQHGQAVKNDAFTLSQAGFAITYFEMFGPADKAKKVRALFNERLVKGYGADALKENQTQTFCELVAQQTQRIATPGKKDYYAKALAWVKKQQPARERLICVTGLAQRYEQGGGERALAQKALDDALRETEAGKPFDATGYLAVAQALLRSYTIDNQPSKADALEKRVDAKTAGASDTAVGYWNKEKVFLRVSKNEAREDLALLREAVPIARAAQAAFASADAGEATGMRIVLLGLGMALNDVALRSEQDGALKVLTQEQVQAGQRAAAPIMAKLRRYLDAFEKDARARYEADMAAERAKADEEAKAAAAERQRLANQPRQVEPTPPAQRVEQPHAVPVESRGSSSGTVIAVITGVLLVAAGGLIAAHFIIGSPAQVRGTATLP